MTEEGCQVLQLHPLAADQMADVLGPVGESSSHWLDVYLCSEVDEAVRLFTMKITEILDVMAAMKTFQVRTNYAPWLCKDTLDLMKARDEVQNLASETKLRVRYKQLRNKVNNRLID